MTLLLHPRAAPGDRIQVWLGALNRTAAPNLQWTLDGAPAQPAVLRPMRSARPADLLNGNPPRVFTGVFEFPGVQPGSVHEVGVTDGRARHFRRVRSLPAAVPGGLTESFNVLLVSCFHAFEDKVGLAGQIVARLPSDRWPHLTLLLGDQVYLDLPTLSNFPNDAKALAERFERDYQVNWCQAEVGYRDILGAAPSVSIPDDHEYWNNFPHASPIIQNSWTASGQSNWKKAALAIYDAFQLHQPGGHERAFELDVRPLSFFLMDTRTFRDPGRRFSLHPDALAQLKAWAARVRQAGLIGVVASGQSLFDEPTSRLKGTIGDRHLVDYGDYEEIVGALVDLSQAGRPVLCLTGDVHYGRLMEVRDLGAGGGTAGRPRLYEIISSPTSLVTTVGMDQIDRLRGAVGSFFGGRNDWPRHSDPAEAPGSFARQLGRFVPQRIHGQKGNHVTLLSFRAAGGGLELRITYFPIHKDGTVRSPKFLDPIKLAS